MDASPSLGALLGCVIEYLDATAGNTFSEEAVALRQRLRDFDGQTARQLSGQLVNHKALDEYNQVVVHGVWALYLAEQRERPKACTNPWWKPGGILANTAFATDLGMVQQSVRDRVHALESTRRISSTVAESRQLCRAAWIPCSSRCHGSCALSATGCKRV